MSELNWGGDGNLPLLKPVRVALLSDSPPSHLHLPRRNSVFDLVSCLDGAVPGLALVLPR